MKLELLRGVNGAEVVVTNDKVPIIVCRITYYYVSDFAKQNTHLFSVTQCLSA